MMCRSHFILFFIGFFASYCSLCGQLYKTTAAEVGFYSSAPLEDIKALTKKGVSIVNSETGEISFRVDIKDFEFRKSKMQEHFNENFMESDRYPRATFKGNIQDRVDLSQNGEHEVFLVGILDVHGKKKKRKIPSRIAVKDGQMILKSRFEIACKDHDIKIPRILWQNIAEVVEVNVVANYTGMK